MGRAPLRLRANAAPKGQVVAAARGGGGRHADGLSKSVRACLCSTHRGVSPCCSVHVLQQRVSGAPRLLRV